MLLGILRPMRWRAGMQFSMADDAHDHRVTLQQILMLFVCD